MADVSVRPARAGDAAAIAAVQLRSWSEVYAPLLPDGALASASAADAEAAWRAAVTDPPTSGHHVLVALAGDTVRGFVAWGPADDPDLDVASAVEVLALVVDPEAVSQGHGSRLFAAMVERLRTDGVATAVTWVFAADAALQSFLQATGWDVDGATREVDMGAVVRQVRLHTDPADAR